ncbi:MAG TPA: phosphohistidine phosphatase SixA [Gemmatimonadales bacterium]|nr:phosphohistidine phosphatase SixA [Gemmatimonadales bacterium]
MELYLVQHGEARPETEDPTRPLTERGRAEVGRVAQAAARAGISLTRIEHSGKQRAQETAEIFAAALAPGARLEHAPDLAPQDDPALAAGRVADLVVPTMLVGHLPHLSRLATLLVTGDSEHEIVAFRPGGIVSLTKTAGGWRVRWVLTPDVVP